MKLMIKAAAIGLAVVALGACTKKDNNENVVANATDNTGMTDLNTTTTNVTTTNMTGNAADMNGTATTNTTTTTTNTTTNAM